MAGWLHVIAVALWRAIIVAVLVMAQMRQLSIVRFRATLGGLSPCGEVVGVVARAVCAPWRLHAIAAGLRRSGAWPLFRRRALVRGAGAPDGLLASLQIAACWRVVTGAVPAGRACAIPTSRASARCWGVLPC
jgi:hypothetical protein